MAKVVVIDDNEAGSYAVTRLLRQAGHQVLQAATGSEGLRAIAEHNPDLLLLDVHLPDISGIEICRQLKGDPKTALIPVIQTSALYTSSQDRVQGLESGADAYLTAPCEPRELLAQVKSLLRTRQAEKALRASEHRYRQLFESNLAGVYLTRLDGSIIDFNEAMMRMLGFDTREALLRHRSTDFYADPQFRQEMVQQLQAEGVLCGREARLRREDGSVVYVIGSAVLLRDPDTGETYVQGVAVDITERKRVEQDLAEAQRRLKQHAENLENTVQERTAKLNEMVVELEHFSYAITHDMRAPLRAMSGFIQLLLTGQCGACAEDSARSHLTRIMTAAQRMDSLIRDALQYSKTLRGEFPLNPVDVKPLLVSITQTYPNLEKAQLSIEGEFPPVLGNEAALTQCFSNLLGNAVKFVAPEVQPRIRVQSERRNDFVRVWIEDNGLGIPAEDREKIFDMFQKLRPEYEGTGIGLAIVKKSAERMGGRVGVESKPGKGSRFWIELKAAPTA